MEVRGAGMEWRVTLELSDVGGTKQTYEVARGCRTDPHSNLDPLGLTQDDGKTLLAGVQRYLVQPGSRSIARCAAAARTAGASAR